MEVGGGEDAILLLVLISEVEFGVAGLNGASVALEAIEGYCELERECRRAEYIK